MRKPRAKPQPLPQTTNLNNEHDLIEQFSDDTTSSSTNTRKRKSDYKSLLDTDKHPNKRQSTIPDFYKPRPTSRQPNINLLNENTIDTDNEDVNDDESSAEIDEEEPEMSVPLFSSFFNVLYIAYF